MNNDQSSSSDSDLNEVVHFNRKAWDQVADAGDKYYRAMTPEQIEKAKQGEWRIRITPTKPVPKNWLEPLAGKEVLLLAGGGGQQSPILAALGADVTVFDLSEKQLARDEEIAQREGFEICTVVGDMADLSIFAENSFDLVVNPCSVCFCPDVSVIWEQVYRVVRPNGHFVTGFIDPIYYLFDAAKMDRGKLEVRHKIPYSDFDLKAAEREKLLGPDRPREFGHSLEALIGGQLKAGFELVDFFQDGWGGSDQLSKRIDTFGATRCIKPSESSR